MTTGRRAFAGQTVLVAGAGVAGRSAIRALSRLGAHILVSGAGAAPDGEVEFVGDVSRPPTGVDLVVTSPGLPPSHPLLVSAQAAGLEVLGELELAWRLRGPDPAAWLMVTGTNGKTTTVRMLESIVRASGRSCLAVGNVGTPVIDAVMADPAPGAQNAYDVLAVEASSFQLTFLDTALPRAGALLNLAEDHLDWHGSMADYAAQKAKVWRAEVAVGNADDAEVMALLSSRRPVADRPVTFTLAAPRDGQLGVVDGMLVDRAFADGVALSAVDRVRPPGPHNVANALAATALARCVGASDEAVAAGLARFEPDPHRNQHVLTVDGVRYVDDSKATNPHAAAASLGAYRRVVWIAGGQLKGADIEPLARRFASALVGAVLLGADRAQVRAALARHAPDLPLITVDRTDDGAMTDVVAAAASLAQAGDVVLLAPAAASKDMFSGYEARGARFAAAVAELPRAGTRG